jgi:uncharacterized membrane protein
MHARVLRNLGSQQLASAALASALAVALLAGRMLRTENGAFGFLLWNLFLAWVPWLASLCCTSSRGVGRFAWLPLWLVFFPNAPYLVTDFVHLRARPPVPVWYDVGMLTAFAWAGLILAVTSLRAIHGRVAERLGALAGWVFVACVAGASGFGIYLGRVLRWNSWDVLRSPWELARQIAMRVLSPIEHFHAWIMAALFGGLMLVVYTAFVSPRGGRRLWA